MVAGSLMTCGPKPSFVPLRSSVTLLAQRMNFHIAPNMRIPESSIIHGLYCDENLGQTSGRENLKEWTFSNGKRLDDRMVHIEVRRVKDRVFAIIQPVSES